MFSDRLKQNLLLIGLILLLGVGLWWALTAGIRAGKSKIVLKNAAALRTGLNYFLEDQDRYPTALEFQDKNIMLNYLSPFPPVNVVSGICKQSFSYKSPTADTYELTFCLPKASGGFPAGQNKVIQQ